MGDTSAGTSAGSLTVPGLLNLGNTCFLNCILQALASVGGLTSYLRQAVCAAGTDAPDLAVALLECLEDLAPCQHGQSCLCMSPGPLMSALRQHVRADVLTDGEQNDAVEALEVLLGAIVSQMQENFKHSRAPELTSLSAWNAIRTALEESTVSVVPLTQLSAANYTHSTDNRKSRDSREDCTAESAAATKDRVDAGSRTALDSSTSAVCSASSSSAGHMALAKQAPAAAVSHQLVSLRLKVAPDSSTVTVALVSTCWGSSIEAPSIGTAQEASQAAPCAASPQSSAKPARAGDPMLQAWMALSRLPLELALQHEAACARCMQPCTSHVSAMLALPLTLPTAEGRWGPFLKPGTTLHDTLAAYFARDLTQDAVCTHCSLRTTLQQAPISCVAVSRSRSGIAPTAVSSTPKDSEQDANMEDDGGVESPRIASSEAASVSGQRGQGNSGGQAAAEKLARLQGLLRGSCAAPECDYAQLAREAGLDWEERRGPLLTRATIARSPQALCLQLRRVYWTRRGRLAKLSGRVSFPEVLNLAPYTAAAAEPLLPAARPLVSHPLGLLSGWQPSRGGQSPTQQPPTSAEAPPSRNADVGGTSSENIGLRQHPVASTQRKKGVAVDSQRNEYTTAAPNPGGKPESDSLRYQLVSVVVHHGGADSGHYTVFRRFPTEPGGCMHVRTGEPSRNILNRSISGEIASLELGIGSSVCRAGTCNIKAQASWVHASDEHIRAVSLEEVLSCDAAVLLYERCPEQLNQCNIQIPRM